MHLTFKLVAAISALSLSAVAHAFDSRAKAAFDIHKYEYVGSTLRVCREVAMISKLPESGGIPVQGASPSHAMRTTQTACDIYKTKGTPDSAALLPAEKVGDTAR